MEPKLGHHETPPLTIAPKGRRLRAEEWVALYELRTLLVKSHSGVRGELA